MRPSRKSGFVGDFGVQRFVLLRSGRGTMNPIWFYGRFGLTRIQFREVSQNVKYYGLTPHVYTGDMK